MRAADYNIGSDSSVPDSCPTGVIDIVAYPLQRSQVASFRECTSRLILAITASVAQAIAMGSGAAQSLLNSDPGGRRVC